MRFRKTKLCKTKLRKTKLRKTKLRKTKLWLGCCLWLAGGCWRPEIGLADAADAPAAGESLELKLQPRAGEERLIRLHVVQNATQIAGKRKSTLRQSVGIDTTYRVLAPATNDSTTEDSPTDGRVRMRATIRAARFERRIDGKIVAHYDSAKPAKNLSEDAELFALLPGLTFDLRFGADGKIADIEGREQVVEQMLDKMQVATEDREYLRPLMQASLNDNAFKNVGNTFASFSDQPLRIGDSWPKRDVVSGDSHLIYDGKLTLAKRDDGLSTLRLQSQIRPDPQRPAKSHALPLSGTQTGWYQVEEATGWTRRAVLEQRWKAHLNAAGAPTTRENTGRTLYMKMVFYVGTLSR